MINKTFFYSLIFAGLMIFFSSMVTEAQNREALDQESTQTEQPQRPNLLKELDLTPDQVQQIRQLNQDRRAEKQAANRRLKAAKDALDSAIYGNEENNAEVQKRVRELHDARLEVLKNRVADEQNLRRILTPQQLGRFRELKQQYSQTQNQNRNSENGLNRNQNRNLNRNQNRDLTPRQQMRKQRRQNRRQQLLNQ